MVWVPRNGAREQHVERATSLVTDARATTYWDEYAAIIDPYTPMLNLTGPCAGVFLIYGPDAVWRGAIPPRPEYVEDAHARQYDRPHPQFDGRRFADSVRAFLSR